VDGNACGTTAGIDGDGVVNVAKMNDDFGASVSKYCRNVNPVAVDGIPTYPIILNALQRIIMIS
jgi:uncharacterized Fe-S radical SAM superfamily protein PflX